MADATETMTDEVEALREYCETMATVPQGKTKAIEAMTNSGEAMADANLTL